MNENTKATASDSDLQTFQKSLILHVLVMDNYTLVNRKSNRIEFSGSLNAESIKTVIAVITDELNNHFLNPSNSSHTSQPNV